MEGENQHTCNNHSFARASVENQYTYKNQRFARKPTHMLQSQHRECLGGKPTQIQQSKVRKEANTRATITTSQTPRWKTNTQQSKVRKETNTRATIKGSQGSQHTCNNHSFASASVEKQHTGYNQSFASDSGKDGGWRTAHIQQSFARASENSKHGCNCGTCAGTLESLSALLKESCVILLFRWSLAMAVRLLEVIT